MISEQRKRILLVDDSPDILAATGEALKEYHDVRVASCGKDALAFLEKERVDLILLDIIMTEMDGYEVIRQLKSVDTLRDIPVIFLTMLSQTEDEKKGLALGAVDFISKPIVPELLLARVNIHLELIEKHRKLKEANEKLSEALAEIKTLRGILPLCTYCKKIRSGRNDWQDIGVYIHDNSEAEVSHGICPDCLKIHYPEGAERIIAKFNKKNSD